MKSSDRILTTHVGSLPRPQEVVDLLFAQDRGEAMDEKKFDATIGGAVADAVNKQAQAGVDIVSDGEMGKISYATYIRHRLTGFEGDSARPTSAACDAAGSGRLSGLSRQDCSVGRDAEVHPAGLQRAH